MSPAIGATEFQAAVEINGRLVDTFLLVLAALFPVVNPPGSAFVFLSLTQHASAEVRRSLTRRVTINAFFVMTGRVPTGRAFDVLVSKRLQQCARFLALDLPRLVLV